MFLGHIRLYPLAAIFPKTPCNYSQYFYEEHTICFFFIESTCRASHLKWFTFALHWLVIFSVDTAQPIWTAYVL